MSPEEIASDESFRLWKLSGDKQAAFFWKNWLLENQDKADLIEAAGRILDHVYNHFDQISDTEIETEIQRLSNTLDNHDDHSYQTRWQLPTRWLQIAACITVLLGLSWWFQYKNDSPATHQSLSQHLIDQSKEPFLRITNDTDHPKLVSLHDGSTVLLHPKSSLSYPGTFSPTKREVFLMGEAFFEIAKKPEQPFYVYANNLVTKVLGTSFIVRAFESDKNVKVVVKTGKVSVFALTDENIKTQQADNNLGGMVLTPNQQIVFSQKDLRLTRSLIADPALLKLPIHSQSFKFKNTPIKDVFSALENSYGIKIQFDEEIMKNCFLTAVLTDEPLFEKVDLICRTVDATYEQLDANIIIYSKGCKAISQ